MLSFGLAFVRPDAGRVICLPSRTALPTKRVRLTDRKVNTRKLQPGFSHALKRVNHLDYFTGEDVRLAEQRLPYLSSINDVFAQGQVRTLEPQFADVCAQQLETAFSQHTSLHSGLCIQLASQT